METKTQHFTDEQFSEELSGFIGTQYYYKTPYGFNYTDGVAFLTEYGGRGSATAFWLLDIVFSYQGEKKIAEQSFQTYTFTRNGDGLDLIITDGNENVLGSQTIEYSDLRMDELKLWLVNNILLLPSEY